MFRYLAQPVVFAAICLAFTLSQPSGANAQVLKDLGQGIKETGKAIGKGVKKTGDAIEKGVKKTGDVIEDGVKKTGEAITGEGGDAEAVNDNAEGVVAETEVPTPQQKPVQKSYLFVQQAGSLTYADGKLTLADLAPSTLFFTDRPERKAGNISNEEFAALWSEESGNGFKADPPNAAIAIAGDAAADPVVVELLSANLSGADLTFSIRAVSGELPADAKDVAMFVDLD